MSEENKIPPEEIPKEQPVNKDPTDETTSSAEPVTETEQRETNNLPTGQAGEKQETDIMETHADHLHKAPGQGWKHYFFEFLMLFLAVTLGFFVENQREHYVEHQREKVLMASMVKDLQADTANFSKMSRGISLINMHGDSLLLLLANNSDLNKNAREIYQQEVWINLYYKAIYTDRTIEQLKNSGNFRLIRNTAVSDGIIEYDGFVRNFVINMQDMGVLDQSKKVDESGTGIFKSLVFRDWMNESFKNIYTIKLPPAPYFLSTDKKLVDVYMNQLGKYVVFNNWFIQNTQQAIKKAVTLDSLVKKEYHLE
ncbi:MAG: hypothetical protein ABI666_00305 [Ferruginibacter sp.]